jgi:hypothetical protein
MTANALVKEFALDFAAAVASLLDGALHARL